MDERRTAYRVIGDGTMRAVVRGHDGVAEGVVVDTSDGGVGVAFPPSGAPSWRVGTSALEVTLSGGPLSEPLTLAATIRARNDGERIVYGIGFRDRRQVARLLPPDARKAFNRRREPRIPAPDGPTSWVAVTAAEGPQRGKRAVGRLLDLSSGGLGMLLDPVFEDVLADCPVDDHRHVRQPDAYRGPLVTCTFSGPGRAGEQVRGGRIVSRLLLEDHIRYGVAFVEADAAEPIRESYEAAWDCVVCSTRLLLAQTHVFCPGCGSARGDSPTYFPDWEEADLNTEHWAWGEERCCPFCDVSASDLATFCGRCGRPLT